MLDEIGFYTLSDYRTTQNSSTSPMWRCELILTDKCNFNCVYCRGLSSELKGDMALDEAKKTVLHWSKDNLLNVRFSGGEPTLYRDLVNLVKYTKSLGTERIALSTNGSAKMDLYKKLIDAGVDDFSVSLDACCASFGDKMAGGKCGFDRIIENIKFISGKVYTTVGIVITEQNISNFVDTVKYAHGLGVSDIRIISAAQYNEILKEAIKIPDAILRSHPILKYRVDNILSGRNVRGIKPGDTNKCYFPLDDSVIAGNYHFPCVIYMREGGNPIGVVNDKMRIDREKWYTAHDTHSDSICLENCLDVCIDFNNACHRKEHLGSIKG